MQTQYKNLEPGDMFTYVNQPYVKIRDDLAGHQGKEWIDHRWTGADGRECRRWIRGGYTLEMSPNEVVKVG